MPFSSPGDLPNPGIKLGSPALQEDTSPFKPPGEVIHDKRTANIILNGEKWKAFPLRSGTRKSVSTFPILNQHSSGSPSYSNQRRKKIKGIQIGKEVKLSLFADDMILYIEHPKDGIRKLLELISEFSKLAEYINTQKSLAFLYTNNEKSERGIKESIPFTIATKRIKYLGINLSNETKYLYTDNYKILMKDIKDNINRWRDIPCPLVGKKSIL